MELGRITITRVLDDEDGSDQVYVEVAQDAHHLITALGMLDLARDTLLNREVWDEG